MGFYSLCQSLGEILFQENVVGAAIQKAQSPFFIFFQHQQTGLVTVGICDFVVYGVAEKNYVFSLAGNDSFGRPEYGFVSPFPGYFIRFESIGGRGVEHNRVVVIVQRGVQFAKVVVQWCKDVKYPLFRQACLDVGDVFESQLK